MSKSKRKYVTNFNKSYTNEFPSIIASRKGSTYAFCSDCACDILIAHGGKNDILRHINGQKHKDAKKFLQTNTKISFPADDDSVIRAEAYFTAFLIEHNLPINCADHAGPLFRKMFPNDGIAKKYAAGRTKTTAIINEMATMEKESVVEILKKSPFSVSTDGSNKSDAKLYPLVVTYYNKNSMIIESTLMSVPKLEGDSTGLNIANLILRELKANGIPFENCLSLGADNAPVMIGEKTGVAGVLKKEIEHLAVIGCACHLINLAAQKGAVVIPDKIDEYLIDIFFYLEKSAKRKSRLQEFQALFNAEQRKILKHVSTRWLSLGRCLDRLVQQWEPLASFFEEEVNGQHCRKRKRDSTPPPTTSARQSILSREERIFLFLSSDLNKALCEFILNVLPIFEVSNATLQSSTPHIHLLRKILMDMLKELFSRFVKPSVIKSSSLLNLDFSELENQKSDTDLVIGERASKILENLPKKKIFFKTVRLYYVSVCDYMIKKFPFKDEILINAAVASLERIDEASFSSLKYFLERYPVLLSPNTGNISSVDVLQKQFCSLQLEAIPQEILTERIDKAWALIGQMKDVGGNNRFDLLSKVMLGILTLPHSNAACERVFSFVTKNCTQFRSTMSTETLEKLLMLKSTMAGKCHEQDFSKALLRRAKSATDNFLNSV